jgi:hypothetical protein
MLSSSAHSFGSNRLKVGETAIAYFLFTMHYPSEISSRWFGENVLFGLINMAMH